MDNLEKVLINLEKRFSNLIFKISKRDDSKKTYIIYKEKENEKSVSFEIMIKESFKILKQSFNNERVKDILVIYDYLDEINERDVLLHSIFKNEINLIGKQVYRKSKNTKISYEYIGNLNNDYKEMENQLWVA